MQHSEDIIKEVKKDKILWCFQYDPETDSQSAEFKVPDKPNPPKSRKETLKD